MSINFDGNLSSINITGRDFSTGTFTGTFGWNGTTYHNLYAVISSNVSSSTSTHNYGSVDSGTTTSSPFPLNSFSVSSIDLSDHDPGNPETSVILSVVFYSVLNSGDTPSAIHTESFTVAAQKKIPQVYNTEVQVFDSGNNQTFSINFDYYGYSQISENSNWLQSEEDDNSVPQTIYFKIIKEVGSTYSTIIDDSYNLYEGTNGATITKSYSEVKPASPESVTFKIRAYYISNGDEIFDPSDDQSLNITSLSQSPDFNISSVSFNSTNRILSIVTEEQVINSGDIVNLFQIQEKVISHPDPSLIETAFSNSTSRSLGQMVEVDNGDGTYTYSTAYSDIVSANLSNPTYCGYNKEIRAIISRTSPTVSVSNSDPSSAITIRMSCPISLGSTPSFPVSGISEMDVVKSSVFGQYVVKFAYHSTSSGGSGYNSGFADATEIFRIFREISQGGVVVDAKTEVLNSSIYSADETDHPIEGTDISWFSSVDTIDVSSLSIDIGSSVDIKYYVQIGTSVDTDTASETYWQPEDEVLFRTITDSLSSISVISDLNYSQTSDTSVSLNWTCDTSSFDEVFNSGGSVRFDLYEMVDEGSLKFDREDSFQFYDIKDMGWRKINSISVSSEDSNPFSHNHDFTLHLQDYYASYAIIIVIQGDLSYLSQDISVLSNFTERRIFIKSSNKRNFKTMNEKKGISDSFARKNLEFDKNIEQVPFSITKKRAEVRGSGISYSVTR